MHLDTHDTSQGGPGPAPNWDSETYIYAIVDTDTPDLSPMPEGLKGSATAVVTCGSLAAVVGPSPSGKLRPRRKNLKAHHQVITQIMERATPLPMSFGIVADSPVAVEQLLADNVQVMSDHLNRVRGHVEVGLRVHWSVDNVFAFFVEEHPELRQARDRYFADGRTPTRNEKIELGQLFRQLLDAQRDHHLETLELGLAGACSEIVTNDPRSDEEVANLALLVERDAVSDVEEAIRAVADHFDDHFTFNYTDPLAPYTFVDLRLES